MSRRGLGWSLAALALVVMVRLWVGTLLSVHTRGMTPGVLPGDVVWIFYGTPRVGDVVQARMGPTEPSQLIRWVAGAGQTVEVSEGVLYVDGMPAAAGQDRRAVACDGPHIRQALERWGGRDVWVVPSSPIAPVVVPEGHAWLMGDHRAEAGDSQRWGTVSVDQIDGVATHVVWPTGQCTAERWSRLINRIN